MHLPLKRAAWAALGLACALDAAAEPMLRLKTGPALLDFRTQSDDLTGPPGSTPPGVKADTRDTRTLGLVAEHDLDDRWSAVLQLGVPPRVRFDGAGAGAALGEVGSARAWFPALLLGWRAPAVGPVQPYAALGAHLTWFDRTGVTPAYTAAFGGAASRASLKASVGPVFKLGAELPLGEQWLVDLSLARYRIATTATLRTQTAGVGEVARSVDVRVDADVLSLMLGHRF